MAPSRRYYEPPALPSVEEHSEEEDVSDSDSDDGTTTAEWSLSSSLLNNESSTSSNDSSGEKVMPALCQRQQDEMKDLLSLGSSSKNESVATVVTPEKQPCSSFDEQPQHSSSPFHYSNALKHNTEYSKYFKMLAAGVPIGWVVKVCEVDRKDPSVLYLNPDVPLESQMEGSSSLDDKEDGDNSEPPLDRMHTTNDEEQTENEDDKEERKKDGHREYDGEEREDGIAVKTSAIRKTELASDFSVSRLGMQTNTARNDIEEEDEGGKDDYTNEGEQEDVEEAAFHDAKESPAQSPQRPTGSTLEKLEKQDDAEEEFHDATELPARSLLVPPPKLSSTTRNKVENGKNGKVILDNYVPQDVILRDFNGSKTSIDTDKRVRQNVASDKPVSQEILFRDFNGRIVPVSAKGAEGKKKLANSFNNDNSKGGFFGFFGRGRSKSGSKSHPAEIIATATTTTLQQEEPNQQQPQSSDVPAVSQIDSIARTDGAEPNLTSEEERRPSKVHPLELQDQLTEEDDVNAGLEGEESPDMIVEPQTTSEPLVDEITSCSLPTLPNSPLGDEKQSLSEYQEDALPLGKEPSYAKYFLMLKARVPIDRVRLIVELDGKDPTILDMDPDLSYASQVDDGDDDKKRENDTIKKSEGDGRTPLPLTLSARGSMTDRDKTGNDENGRGQHHIRKRETTSRQQPIRAKKVVNGRRNNSRGLNLPLSKDPAYARYFLMLKARVPIDRVRNVVELDGKDPSILDLDPNRSYASQVGSGDKDSDDEEETSDDNGGSSSPMMGLDALDEKENNEDSRQQDGKESSVSCVTKAMENEQDSQLDATAATFAGDAEASGINVASRQQGGQVSLDRNGGPKAQVRLPLHHPAAFESSLQPPAPQVGRKGAAGLSDAGRANLDALFARRVGALAESPSAATASVDKNKIRTPTTVEGGKLVSLPPAPANGGVVILKDDPEYAKYFKMLKLGLPLGAAKQAMVKDGKDATILDLDHNKPLVDQRKASSDCRDDPPLKEDPEFTKYFKMLKIKLPLGAVKQAMERDGKDVAILDLDPDKSLASQRKASSDSNDGPALKDDPEYTKYFKMLNMKLPLGSVKQAMVEDGKDIAILDLDPDKSLASQRKADSDSSDSQALKNDSDGPALKDDPDYSKYFKMLKMKLPLGAVKQAMVKDGKDVAILDLDPEKSLASQKNGDLSDKPNGEQAKQRAAKVARKRLFWNSIDKSKLHGSLWAQAQSGDTLDLKGLEYDEDEFASLFTSTGTIKVPKSDITDVSAKQPRPKQPRVQLIDSRRQMNGSILLAKYKHDYKMLAQKVDHLDSDNMDETELLALMQLLPTKDEALAIRSYLPTPDSPQAATDDAIGKLGECEKYMASMLNVKNAKSKFECMLYRAQFNGSVTDLSSEIGSLREALFSVRNSDKLARLMLFALRLGNTLNTGASGEKVAAITLDSLLKLHEAKAFDKKTSVLHYLVSIIQKNDEEVLNVSEELLPALKAERIVADALRRSLNDLQTGLKRLQSMVKLVSSEMDAGANLISMETFIQEADVELKRLSEELGASKIAFADLLKYFGENEDMPVDEFFSTLTRFIAMFEGARADVRRMQETKARRERMAKNQKTKSTAKISTDASFSNDRSAVLHEIVKVHSKKILKKTALSEEKKIEL